jgi:hypothetical protein
MDKVWLKLPVERFSLQYQGKLMEAGLTLGDHHITAGSRVKVVEGVSGGGHKSSDSGDNASCSVAPISQQVLDVTSNVQHKE